MLPEQSEGETPPFETFHKFEDWPDEGELVEFRLAYEGKLPAASQTNKRRPEKHAIRKQIHLQMAELWNQHEPLRVFNEQRWGDNESPSEFLCKQYARCGYRFIPLVNDWFTAACSLDILFLRRDQPGSLIRSGGDIDNRIKILFDALRMPATCDGVTEKPASGEDPFFCLLEDDRLITDFKVTTDRLLTPPGETRENDVKLIIHVKTQIVGLTNEFNPLL